MVKLRLTRIGAKGQPSYRIVAIDSRKARDGMYIEQVGFFDPMTNPETIKVEADKAKKWIANGAQPTDTVKVLLKKAGVFEEKGE